jgi:hypothetical protein
VPSAPIAAVSAPSGSAPALPALPSLTASVTVALSATPSRASLFLDGHALPSNPYKATLPTDGSTHRVLAEAVGYATRTVTLTPDHDTDVLLALDPIRSTPAPPTPAPAPAPAETSSPPKSNKCNPPYVIDADGIKRFRPECLAQ